MNKINNEKYNAAYDLINRNILSNPDKIAFIDNNNNKITYNELFIKVKTFAQSIRNIDIAYIKIMLIINIMINN